MSIKIEREFLNDEELLKVCSANRKIWSGVCDDEFLKRRLTSKYPGIEKYKGRLESWERFFLRTVYYISRMREEFNIEYKDGNFKEQYKWYSSHMPDTIGIIRKY